MNFGSIRRSMTKIKITTGQRQYSSIKAFRVNLASVIEQGNLMDALKYSTLSKEWKAIHVPKEELDLNTVLVCGQSFRWRKSNCENTNLAISEQEWIGAFDKRVWCLKQMEDKLFYKTFQENDSTDSTDDEQLLRSYLQLDISVNSLYNEWCKRDPKFASLTKQDYQGIRILKQNPIETIFTFICSSNNNISRITQMVDKLCRFYGEPIVTLNGDVYYDFPQVEKLQGNGVENKLKEEKFGYRAGFIVKCAKKIVQNGGVDWVNKLTKIGYDEARKELQTLDGVGRKVADCICLMSLGYHEAIPIDTHIHQVAKQYLPHLKKVKTLTEKTYAEISEYFQSIYGDYAGWAQSVLFTSTLRHLKNTPVSEQGSSDSDKKGKRKLETEKTSPNPGIELTQAKEKLSTSTKLKRKKWQVKAVKGD